MEKLFDEKEITKAVLVSVRTARDDEHDCEASLAELGRLLETAGGELCAEVVQVRESPDARTYIGSGKLAEIRDICENSGAKLVIFDGELSPAQIKNAEDTIGDVTVIDRPMLILDIFALHARTGEGKLQVELAQLKYTIPRLAGHGTEMSRLGGGIGTRGPGETKLESDRRHIKRRIAALEEQIREMEKNRKTQREKRDKSGIFRIAVAGYTNAGKSTLLNYLTGAGILAEDKLFATLDPTTRKYELPSGTEVLLTDTVGFIRNLPTQLIKAFRSTLEEVMYCDAILIVADASDPEYEAQLSVTEELINELGASDKPVIYAFNKCDVREEGFTMPLGMRNRKGVCISALTGEGMNELAELIEQTANDGKVTETLHIPQSKGGAVSYLYANANVISVEYEEAETVVTAVLDKKTLGAVKKMIGE
ncbi:MAG: GTPase HflX [Clostridia bacterium]|nr:GTPase HflX [Clostridia bacterium]